MKDATLKYFDSNLPIYIETDALKKGIGVVMLQPGNSVENASHTEVPNNLRPVFYASKTLTATESNYSNIEHEMLGVVFFMLHFKHFMYRRQVHIITDYKPLITLFAKNLATTSPRLSRMIIKIFDYVIVLHHQEGNKMHLSDAISRLSVHDSDAAKSKAKLIADFNISIHEISEITGFKSLTLQDIKEETIKDCQLTKLKTNIIDGFLKHKHECTEDIRSFYDYMESLTIIDGIVLKDKRIVIPAGLHEQALENLHRSHMGIVKTKERASTSMFWPKMYSDIENYLSTCHPCMIHKVKQTAEPLERDILTKPWHSLTLDNFEFKGSLFLIIFDHFTRFIVVKKCVNLSARAAIQSLLGVHGVPSHIRSDRGRNFVSSKFGTFCKDLGISLNFSSGCHHSTNQAEQAVHTVKDLMKCYNSAGVHWCIALLEFLCTPGPDAHYPSELLGRQFRGILPMIDTNTVNSDKSAVRKDKEKEKFDDKHPRELKPLLVGSTVSYLNSGLKTWNVGVVVACSPDNRSYHVRTESGTVISQNRVHLRLYVAATSPAKLSRESFFSGGENS